MKQRAEKVPGGYMVEGKLYKEEELVFWHVIEYPLSGATIEEWEVTAEEWDEIVESGIESKWVEVQKADYGCLVLVLFLALLALITIILLK